MFLGALLTCCEVAGLIQANAAIQARPIEEIAAESLPAIATLELFDSHDQLVGSGTGFLIGNDQLVTNWHVAAAADRILADFGAPTKAVVVAVLAASQDSDLALLQIRHEDSVALFSDSRQKRRPLCLETKSPAQGATIYVLGSPRGLHGTLTNGIVSSVRDLEPTGRVLQITAPISPGSSGSPVIDVSGRVVGVVSFLLGNSQGLNFAIPAATLDALPRGAPVPFAQWSAEIPKTPLPVSDEAIAAMETFAAIKRSLLQYFEQERSGQEVWKRDQAARVRGRLLRTPLT